METVMPQIRFFALYCLLLLFAFPTYAYTDFSEADPLVKNTRIKMEEFVTGRPDTKIKPERLEKYKRYLCENLMINDLLATEVGKLLYNDDFDEVINEEHGRDIEALKQAILGTEDCIERFRSWLAYDDKWYKAERDEKFAARAELEALWKTQIVDTGPENWDGVINGTFFSIPRKYIWFGSLKPDGIQAGMNLQFFYPDMTARPVNDGYVEGERTNIGGVISPDFYNIKPCVGYDGIEYCTDAGFNKGFRKNFLNCRFDYTKNYTLGKNHYGFWRGLCKQEVEPVFNERVGMWEIKNERRQKSGFYEGNPAFPDVWFQCKPPPFKDDKPIGICEGYLRLNDHIYFQYSFPRELFWQHREIREGVLKKIKSFIVDPATMQDKNK